MSENDAPEKNLTPRQRRAVQALLATGDLDGAAAAAGVSRRTLQRWMHLDAFRQALLDAEGAALRDLSRELVRLARIAVKTLEDTMQDTEATPGQRIRAADIILARLLQIRELTDIETRLQALEQVAT